MRHPQGYHILSRSVTVFLIGLALLPLAGGRAAADDADDVTRPLLTAVGAAVADHRTEQSKQLGFKSGPFSEMPPEGAILIGLDVGVGEWLNIETVYAIRALYLSPKGEYYLEDHGLFRDKPRLDKKILKTKVLRVIRVRAQPGYAVGGVTLRTGLNINGLSLTFMRIKGGALDPKDSYAGDWIGDRTGGGEASLDGGGDPVIGLFGSQDNQHVSALGLIYARPAAQPAPAAQPTPPAPVVNPIPPFEPPPVKLPVVRPADPPRVVKPPEPPNDDPPDDPPQADPPKADPPRPIAEPEPSAGREKVAATRPNAPPASSSLWTAVTVPLVIFGAVTGLVFVVLLGSVGWKGWVARQNHPKKKAKEQLPDVIVLASPPAPTAIYERPRDSLSKPPPAPAVEDEPLELTEEDLVPPPPAPTPNRADVPDVLPASDDGWPRLEL